MSDNGGSDLDAFNPVSPAPPPPRKQTLLGLVAPPGLAPPPPPPSSALTQQGLGPPLPPPGFAAAPEPESAPDFPDGLASEVTETSLSPLKPPAAPESLDSPEPQGVAEQQAAGGLESEASPAPALPAVSETDHPSEQNLGTPNLSALDVSAPDYGEDDDALATEIFSTHDFAAGAALTRPAKPTDPHAARSTASSTAGGEAPVPKRLDRSSAPPKPKSTPVPPSRSLSPASSARGVHLPPPSRPVALVRAEIPQPPSSGRSAPPPRRPRASDPSQTSPSHVVPAPPSVPAASEWEEDEKTEVFSRETGAEATRKLLGTSIPRTSGIPDVPPPPMSRPSAPVPTPPKTLQRRAPVVSYASLETEPKSVPPGPAQSRTPLLIAAAIAVALLVALTLYLRPSTGRLDVTVAGPGNLPIDSVQVIVNGKVVCETSPCTVNDLPANTYHVQAKAPGYHDTAVLSVLVTGGQGAVHNVSMVRASGTGIRVKAEGTGLRLFVDDREVGPLPQELKDLAPGEHKVRVQGEHFETWEQTVVVQANEIQTVGPLALKVIKGLAMIKDGGNASDARVVLESGEDRRSLPTLPINLHIDTSKPHTLIATKEGFETFTQALRFEAGQAERTFEVRLVELPAPEDEARPQVAHRRRAPRPVAPSTPDETVASAGKATLNFNSIPASAVVLDGRPIGRTPKLGVAVSAGKHTVVFLEQGQRVSKSVSVAAGESKTVIHRFE